MHADLNLGQNKRTIQTYKQLLQKYHIKPLGNHKYELSNEPMRTRPEILNDLKQRRGIE